MAQHKVSVIGALGRMGQEVRTAVGSHPDLVVGGALEAPGHEAAGSTIEEGVVIYSNATVLGGETVIGANSMIGASVSIMNKKIAPNTLVTVEKANLRYREAS